MALAQILQRRVKATKAEREEEDLSVESEDVEEQEEGSRSAEDDGGIAELSKSGIRDDDGQDDKDTSEEDNDHSDTSSAPPTPEQSLTNISFGALASAQASLGLKRKRPFLTEGPNKRRSPSPFLETQERLAGKKDHRVHSRTSKHAPTELSSKKAVSRKRSIVAAPIIAHRDPRFEALSGTLDSTKLEKNYSFLNDYRTSEISALKSSVRTTKDDAAKEALKRQLLSMESREKARAAKEVQQEVLREHRRREKEAVEKGKKPFYLKKGEQKKLVLVKKFEEMEEKKVERVIERRNKKKAGKERKGMPDGRRSGNPKVDI
ncbi:rRNA biogenesis protein rrp36 [Xylographa carneopallida]|nr:rRNA biogenesis protein rrp36 [Xylographa carneopallida]